MKFPGKHFVDVVRLKKTVSISCNIHGMLERVTKFESFFLDRTTAIGQMIDSYLRSTSELDDRAIHLLFSANRWELA